MSNVKNPLAPLSRGYYAAYEDLMRQAREHWNSAKLYELGTPEHHSHMYLYRRLAKDANECKQIGDICENYYKSSSAYK